MTILNVCTKKVWKLIECTTYIYIFFSMIEIIGFYRKTIYFSLTVELEFGFSLEILVLFNGVRLWTFVTFSFVWCMNGSGYWSLEKDFMI